MPRAYRIYLSNIPFKATREEISVFFAPRKVLDVKIALDKETGQSRGFAFVDLSSDEEVESACATLNRTILGGRTVTVARARGTRDQR